MIANLTPEQLRNAADLQERIQSLQQELAELLGSGPEAVSVRPSGRRKLSAQGLANIRAGARKRWAAFKKGNGVVSKGSRRSDKMSAAGRARIGEALRARWAAAKRSGRNAL